jgi:6-pyruvoyltetrahydropterin/6-carboxytetrahydropterin synthase
MIISKTFFFDAAHRLPFHKGKCFNLHGHRYEVTVGLLGTPDENGIVMDYGDIKKTIGAWIDENLDHATLVSADDTALLEYVKSNGFRHYVFLEQTTAELMSLYLAHMFSKMLPENIVMKRLVIKETPTSEAVYEVE